MNDLEEWVLKIFISIIITLIFTELAEAAVKFKGGQISSSSGNLKTEKPAERPDATTLRQHERACKSKAYTIHAHPLIVRWGCMGH